MTALVSAVVVMGSDLAGAAGWFIGATGWLIFRLQQRAGTALQFELHSSGGDVRNAACPAKQARCPRVAANVAVRKPVRYGIVFSGMIYDTRRNII